MFKKLSDKLGRDDLVEENRFSMKLERVAEISASLCFGELAIQVVEAKGLGRNQRNNLIATLHRVELVVLYNLFCHFDETLDFICIIRKVLEGLKSDKKRKTASGAKADYYRMAIELLENLFEGWRRSVSVPTVQRRP